MRAIDRTIRLWVMRQEQVKPQQPKQPVVSITRDGRGRILNAR